MLVYTLETLGERLSHARATAKERGTPCKASKVTQGDVANVVGMTRQGIVRIEKNVNGTSNEKLEKIATFLNVNPIWLITGKGSMTEADEAVISEALELANKHISQHSSAYEVKNDSDLIGQISAIHALTGQILKNADCGRNNKTLLSMLEQAITEYLSQSQA
ncbi:helix-turn-helix domain-containing protein [Endozoicomonas sp. ISHI1]|uniref:helix-turn-helix domain-containing protein n=1 Tax=Endozoicomonas sp. ISHI1 TaxID=2825882 RepID=UPI0021490382|nr:helix-turn-helix transcriptional regulator [Endozoicomonas sp. ISHI1]